ncbi:MAG: permease-like cell division protein FtsX [Proteobacteria bacterium]|nr:permease-like cell division protein FtsX [Pseudomonadota bacterium]
MGFKTALLRASRGFRQDLRLHFAAVSSLAVAFLCLGGTLLAMGNLTRVAEHFGQQRHIVFYLKPDASEQGVAQLRASLEALPEVREVRQVGTREAREEFGRQFGFGEALSGISPAAFPAFLELRLNGEHAAARAAQLVERVGDLAMVDEIETYDGWFGKLTSLLQAGRTVSGIVALVVALCVLAVVSNTIRLAVSSRRQEIEVLKLCGASDRFVRQPFVMEGAMQGAAAAVLAILALLGGYLVFHDAIDAIMGPLVGIQLAFVDLRVLVGLVLGGLIAGTLGSVLALRQYLAV